MPKRIHQEELDLILDIIKQAGEFGFTRDEIEARLDLNMNRRTLQRRLSKLQEKCLVVSKGSGSSRRYAFMEDQDAVDDMGEIPLSSGAKEIELEVRKPVHLRKPVSYNLPFFTEYQPNKSSYLTDRITRDLRELGSIPKESLPTGTYTRKIYDRLLIDLSWNSSRLEGNTYSLLETERLISYGEEAEGKDAREAQMILNHKAAIELLVEKSPEVGLNRHTILNLHALLSDNLLPNSADCGRLRAAPVKIGGTQYLPLDIPQQIEEIFIGILAKAEKINDPFEQSFFLMVHLPYLQPFMDVNKRVSRLAANIPLIQANYCPLSFIEVPQQIYVNGMLGVYEMNRIELLRDVYIWAYKQSCLRYGAIRQSLGEPDPFRMKYRVQLMETVREIVRANMKRASAVSYAETKCTEIPMEDRNTFKEAVMSELDTLHEGNFARYRLRPSEFQEWKSTWDLS